MRVLWEEKSMWIKCKFSELPSGEEVAEHAHMFEIGNRGGTIIMMNDEEPSDHIK